VSTHLVGRTAIKAHHLHAGESAGFEVLADQFVQVIALQGKQAAALTVFSAADHGEKLSTGQTRLKNNSLMLQKSMSIYSNRGNALLELAEDTVGRHDLLFPLPDGSAEDAGEKPDGGRISMASALAPFSITADDLPDPVNVFMKVAILQRGELEIQESLAEKNDFILLRAVTDTIVAVTALLNGSTESTGPSEVLVRVFR
jgi:uncharacterized protein YcgI (DUF1989 family)